jgi:hypothetical protein
MRLHFPVQTADITNGCSFQLANRRSTLPIGAIRDRGFQVRLFSSGREPVRPVAARQLDTGTRNGVRGRSLVPVSDPAPGQVVW